MDGKVILPSIIVPKKHGKGMMHMAYLHVLHTLLYRIPFMRSKGVMPLARLSPVRFSFFACDGEENKKVQGLFCLKVFPHFLWINMQNYCIIINDMRCAVHGCYSARLLMIRGTQQNIFACDGEVLTGGFLSVIIHEDRRTYGTRVHCEALYGMDDMNSTFKSVP